MNSWVILDVPSGNLYNTLIDNGIFYLDTATTVFIRNPIIQDSVNPSVYWEISSIQDGVIQWVVSASITPDTVYMYDNTLQQWFTLQISDGIQNEVMSSAPPPEIIAQPTGGGGQWVFPKNKVFYKRYRFNVDGKKAHKYKSSYRIVGYTRIQSKSRIDITASKKIHESRTFNISARRAIDTSSIIQINAKSRREFNDKLILNGRSKNQFIETSRIDGRLSSRFIDTANINGTTLFHSNIEFPINGSKRMIVNEDKIVHGQRDITNILVALDLLNI